MPLELSELANRDLDEKGQVKELSIVKKKKNTTGDSQIVKNRGNIAV